MPAEATQTEVLHAMESDVEDNEPLETYDDEWFLKRFVSLLTRYGPIGADPQMSWLYNTLRKFFQNSIVFNCVALLILRLLSINNEAVRFFTYQDIEFTETDGYCRSTREFAEKGKDYVDGNKVPCKFGTAYGAWRSGIYTDLGTSCSTHQE